MTRFSRYVGVDYTGEGDPSRPTRKLQVFVANSNREPAPELAPDAGSKWSRAVLAEWLMDLLSEDRPTIVGIDHAFSFPKDYMRRHGIETWDGFLDDFCRKWQTDRHRVHDLRPGITELGHKGELRLTDRWAQGTKSVFHMDVPGAVAYSTLAGLPWIRKLRRTLRDDVHFWPFDDFRVPRGMSVVAEVYPSVFRRRYSSARKGDQKDAFSVCRWLQERDDFGFLNRYIDPPLSEDERNLARLEGWILGVA